MVRSEKDASFVDISFPGFLQHRGLPLKCLMLIRAGAGSGLEGLIQPGHIPVFPVFPTVLGPHQCSAPNLCSGSLLPPEEPGLGLAGPRGAVTMLDHARTLQIPPWHPPVTFTASREK